MSRLHPIQCEILSQENNAIVHGFFTRQGGVSKGIYESLNTGPSSDDEADNVAANRAAIVSHLGLPPQIIVTPWQHHSSDTVIATSQWKGEQPKADAVVTNTPNLPIAIVTADCGPVLFCDPTVRVVAAAHAGWRGAVNGVLESTISKMVELGAKRENILATLGPTISGTHYEVDEQFATNLRAVDNRTSLFISASRNEGHAMFDLPAYIVMRLTNAGVQARWTGHCTYADPELFYSYRRMTHRAEKDYGRQISAIAITK